MIFYTTANIAKPLTPSERIITAGGTVTEIVFNLGLESNVVAVDQSSSFPPRAQQLPSVGYYRDLAAEGILSQRPDRLLLLEGSGRQSVLEQLQRTSVPITVYKKPHSVADLIELVNKMGSDLGRETQAQQLTAQITADMALLQKIDTTHDPIRGIFILSAGQRGVVIAGNETVAALMFDYAGVKNLGQQHNGYKPINLEALIMQQPEFMVVPSHVIHSLGGKRQFCQQPLIRELPVAKACRVLVMDGLLAMGMTPRVAKGIKQLQDFVLINVLPNRQTLQNLQGTK